MVDCESIMYIVTILLFIVVSLIVLYNTVTFDWLTQVTRVLILSLPFERIPSVQVAGANLRLSTILVWISLYLITILYLKKDAELLRTKLSKPFALLFLFILVSLPSVIFIQDWKRFLITEFATITVFLGFFLVATFTTDYRSRIKELLYVFIGVIIFGFYQFFGDLIGIPPILTGLREQYTKIVFGIPRIQATAIEPLYYAGMLFLPIYFSIISLVSKHTNLFSNVSKKYIRYSLKITISIALLISFFLTISKSAIAILVVLLPFFIFLFLILFGSKTIQTIKQLGYVIITIIMVSISFLVYNPTVQTIVTGIASNIVSTIVGESSSSDEREYFLYAAQEILERIPITGIGSGQYGVEARYYLPFLGDEESFLIVNNVYLEIWVEHGILALFTFLTFLLSILYPAIISLIKNRKNLNTHHEYVLILLFTTISYLLQWLTFSPIFIMPIFIILGLLYKASQEAIQ